MVLHPDLPRPEATVPGHKPNQQSKNFVIPSDSLLSPLTSCSFLIHPP